MKEKVVLLSFLWLTVSTTQQALITWTDLVNTKCQSSIWHETALAQY